MGLRFYEKPQMETPILIASWPGIGNIGLIAVDTLRGILEAEEFGEIEPWEFFIPSGHLSGREFWNTWNFLAINFTSRDRKG